MIARLKVSMCAFQNGEFSLYLIDADTNKEIQIEGKRTFTEEEHEFFNKLMPACVFTTYETDLK